MRTFINPLFLLFF